MILHKIAAARGAVPWNRRPLHIQRRNIVCAHPSRTSIREEDVYARPVSGQAYVAHVRISAISAHGTRQILIRRFRRRDIHDRAQQ